MTSTANLLIIFSLFGSILMEPSARAQSPAAHQSKSGGEHSGGGGYRELQFQNIGYAVVELLSDSKNIPPELARLDFKRLKQIIKMTTAEGTQLELRPSPNGKVQPALIKDALNTPARKLIQFNIDSWDLIPTGSLRAALVLHEYLGVMNALGYPNCDDRHYAISHYLYAHPALKLWFDNTEVAQSMTETLTLDFPLQCSYQFRNEARVQLGKLGTYQSKGIHIEQAIIGHKVANVVNSKESLQLFIYDESNVNATYLRMMPSKSTRSTVKIVVAKGLHLSSASKTQIFSQSIAIAPNLKFEIDLEFIKLKIECHRVRMSGLIKPTDWE